MSEPMAVERRGRAGVLGALALAAEVADDVVLSTVRDVHAAAASHAYRVANAATGGAARVPQAVYERLSGVVYAGLGTGLRATSGILREADRRGLGAPFGDGKRGRTVLSVVNGVLGDRLAEHGSGLAIEMAVRSDGHDVPVHRESLQAAFPQAGPDLVVFLHGLGESDDHWRRGGGDRCGYGDRLGEETGWTPLYLRANTGLPVLENGRVLAGLLDELVAAWPVEVGRIALVGHSMGGLIIRAACGVVTGAEPGWNRRVTDVVTLGTPHLGAPLERAVALGARALGTVPEAAPFGRILDYRSRGILDLRRGLAGDVANLPHARYRLVAATLAGSPRHPLSWAFGDLLVRYPSATGRPRRAAGGPEMFPGADVLHVRGDHFDLLDHPQVYAALRGWLDESAEREHRPVGRGSARGSG